MNVIDFLSFFKFAFLSQVSKEDNLPKKICDGCLYKLELLYQFWNTTVNAEKQLLEWLNQAGLDANKKATDGAMAVVNDVQDAADLVLKEEAIDITEVRGDEEDDLSTEANSYILQQQQLPYQTFEYQQDGTKVRKQLNISLVISQVI